MLGIAFVVLVCSFGGLGLDFLGLTLVHGSAVFGARRSFSRAVPYFSIRTGHLLASAGWLWSSLPIAMQLMHLVSWGHWPSAVVSIESPFSLDIVHLWQFVGSGCTCSFSSWCPLQIRHLCVSLHWWVVWSSLQHVLHWVTGGRSWKALSVQCRPKAASAFWLRICRAVDSFVSAKTRDDLGVEDSSSSVRSQRGFATISPSASAYIGLHATSSW